MAWRKSQISSVEICYCTATYLAYFPRRKEPRKEGRKIREKGQTSVQTPRPENSPCTHTALALLPSNENKNIIQSNIIYLPNLPVKRSASFSGQFFPSTRPYSTRTHIPITLGPSSTLFLQFNSPSQNACRFPYHPIWLRSNNNLLDVQICPQNADPSTESCLGWESQSYQFQWFFLGGGGEKKTLNFLSINCVFLFSVDFFLFFSQAKKKNHRFCEIKYLEN